MKLFDSGNCLESAALGLEGGTGTGRHATLSHSLSLSLFSSDAVRHINTHTQPHVHIHAEREINNFVILGLVILLHWLT